MAKILSGGYSFEGAPINSQKQNIPTAKQVEAPESLLQFGARNIAQFPASIYETARSGFGIGNLLNMLSERANRSGEGYRQSAVENISSMLGANPEIINEQLASPHLFNMARRGILPTTQEANQELATFLPKYMTEHRPEDYWTQFALTQAPLLAAGGAFKSLPALAKGIGETLGVLGGSELGSAAGGEIGKLIGDEELGAALGGLGGGLAGAKGSRAAMTYGLNRPTKYFPKAIKEKLQNEISGYRQNINNLEEQRTANYAKAKALEGNKKGSAKPIKDFINKLHKEMEGVHPAEKNNLRKIIKEIDNRLTGGELSLSSAKRIQKNLNDQIYNRDASRTFKRYMGEVVQKVNEFIKDVGGEEHSKYWQDAESETRELKKLQRGEKDFIRQKNREIKENKERFKPEPFVNRWGLAGLASTAGSLFGGHKVGTAIGALTKAGQSVAQEIKIAREILKEHPDLHKEYMNLAREANKMSQPDLMRHINALGTKLEKVYQEQPKEKKQEEIRIKNKNRIISGGMIV